MHILEIPSFFPPCGGLFCLDQAKALKANGNEVRILSNVQLSVRMGLKDFISRTSRRHWHNLDGIEVYQSYQKGCPKVIRYNVNRWVRIVCSMFNEYVEQYGYPDILHAHCCKWAGYAAMLISETYSKRFVPKRLPYVITEHLPLMLLEQEFGKAPSNAWQIALLKRAYEHADMVIPVSNELVDDISSYYGKNYRWTYVSNTIDTEFFHYEPREPFFSRPFHFCCLADFYYRKGYDVLFPAFKKLLDSGMDVTLSIAGLNTDSRACREMVGVNHIEDRVRVMGKLKKEEVRSLLYHSDALVLASRSEVQPLVLLEAMSTGIPVVSTECVPQCQRIDGCYIVPIESVDKLADAMQHVAEKNNHDGRAISNHVREMASPDVVGKILSELFSSILTR